MIPSFPAAVPTIQISFRTIKVDVPLSCKLTAAHVKQAVLDAMSDDSLQLVPSDLKILFKGKTLTDDDQNMLEWLLQTTTTSNTGTAANQKLQKSYRILVTGRSASEAQAMADDHEEHRHKAPRIRDDLTDQGRRDLARRQRLGQLVLQHSSKQHANKTKSGWLLSPRKYGFEKIETLPDLANEDQARHILTSLANDPGILACMAKHQYRVGSLAELAPDGQVGQSAVCVMGLNRSQGQQILLRLRTDDYQGFRKILSIRKVLYHELAHNEHSEHDDAFFQLMRTIEDECTEMVWTHGVGTTGIAPSSPSFEGGIYRLGGTPTAYHNDGSQSLTPRELAARAAMQRMTVEEEEIQQQCGCGREALFLPPTCTIAKPTTSRPRRSDTSSKHDHHQSQRNTSFS